MTIASEIARLQAAKVDIMAALVEKGVDVTRKKLADVPDLIDSIGGGVTTDAIIFFDGIHEGIGYQPNKNPFNYLSYDTTSIPGKKIPFIQNSTIGNVDSGGSLSERYRRTFRDGIVWESAEICEKLRNSNAVTIEFWATYVSSGNNHSYFPLVELVNRYDYLCIEVGLAAKYNEKKYIVSTADNFTNLSGFYSGNASGWHHYVISWADMISSYFVDGVKVYTRNTSTNLRTSFANTGYVCMPARYSGYSTYGSTGLKIYDYEKYTENFTPSPIPQINA